jgi:cytidine deaminase
MRINKQKFETAILSRAHELSGFWLRKSKSPVLAVLVTQKSPDDPMVFTHGMNVEVSMPTGSLCSERAAIAAALAADPSLSRQHFKAIAVLSHSLELREPASVVLHLPHKTTPPVTGPLMTPLSLGPGQLAATAASTSGDPPTASAAVAIAPIMVPSFNDESYQSPTFTPSSQMSDMSALSSLPPPLATDSCAASPVRSQLLVSSPKVRGISSPLSLERRPSTMLPRSISAYRTLLPAKELNPLAPCGSCTLFDVKFAVFVMSYLDSHR